MFKILIADTIAKPGLEDLKKNPNFEVIEKTKITPEELTAEIGAYHALVVRSRTKVTAEMIEKADNMKLIVRGGVGTDNIDKKAAQVKGIAVKNTPKASSISVAELVMGMLLSGVRELVDATASTKLGKWEKKRFEGIEIFDKTLGIVGYGNIGKEIAKRAIGMGMHVLAYDPYVTSTDISGVKLTNLDEVLRTSDFITLNCPKTDETKGLINEKSIEILKDGVGIINCSRGGIIDEVALKSAIDKGKVAFAGIDVYGTEPPDPSHPFFGMEKVILTPHVGAQTKEGQTRVAIEVAAVINDFFK